MQTTILLPAEVRARAEVIAERDGLALTNVIARLLSEAMGLPVPAYCLPRTTDQQELPLKAS